MGRKCSVVNCRSGYEGEAWEGMIPIYKFPDDAEQRRLWISCLPNKLDVDKVSNHMGVCAFHWPEDTPLVRLNRGRYPVPTVPPSVFFDVPESSLPMAENQEEKNAFPDYFQVDDNTTTMHARGKFTEETDVLTLRACVAIKVFSLPCGLGWKTVAETLRETGKVWDSFTARSCRDRVTLLLDRYEEEQRDNPSIAINQPVDEKDLLLHELLQMKDAALQRRKSKYGPKDIHQIREEQDFVMDLVSHTNTEEASQSSGTCSTLQARRPSTDTEELSDTCESTELRDSTEFQAETSSTSEPKKTKRRGKKRRRMDVFLEYLIMKEENRARERREEIELRRQELDLLRDQNTALLNLLTQHLAK